MNGDEQQRLIILETKFKERWDGHDKRSEEIWGEMKEMIKTIFTKLDKLPCETHKEKFKSVQAAFIRLWSIVILMLSGIIGGFFWMIRQ